MFQRKKVVFVIIFIVIFAQGCSTVKPYSYIPKEADGEIFIFRRSAFNAGGMHVVVRVDGENVAKLSGEQYTSIKLGEGNHKVGIKGDGLVQVDMRDIAIKQKQILYFEAEPNPVRTPIIFGGAACGVVGVFTESPLVFGFLLAPIIDVAAVKTFLLKESSEEEFKTAAEKFREVKVK